MKDLPGSRRVVSSSRSFVIPSRKIYFNSPGDNATPSTSHGRSLGGGKVKGTGAGVGVSKGVGEGSRWFTQQRLVQGVTLSLKYPEVFFPRNFYVSFFPPSLNSLGYPARIEKLPCSLFPTFVFPSYSPFSCSRSNLYAPPPCKQPPITRGR